MPDVTTDQTIPGSPPQFPPPKTSVLPDSPPVVPSSPEDRTLAGTASKLPIYVHTPPPPSHRFPRLPGFNVVGELGRGGMGVVYHARQERLNRPAAVKMLLHYDVSDLSDVIRFRSEAEAVAAIAHPHVVKVFESGQHDGRPYFAMEYLPGGTLHAKLRKSAPFDPDEAAGLVEKLARAVHAAHALGIVHRDLKPGNVLFDAAGEPRVTDFGLAKRSSCELTRTQAVMGTPAYMPPEQAAGKAKYVGPAADIYALGVILYECLTGSTPFASEDSLVLMHQVMADDPPPIRKKVPGVPRDLELICLKCLEKQPTDRYATAVGLADDLRHYLGREPVSVRPAGVIERTMKWARRRPTAAAAWGLGALATLFLAFGGIAAVLAYKADRHWQTADQARRQLEAQAGELERAREAEADHRRKAEDARDELSRKHEEVGQALWGEMLSKVTADIARQDAENALAEARSLRALTARITYSHNVSLATREADDGNFVRAQQLLANCPKELRGWEWAHAYRVAHQEIGAGVSTYQALDITLNKSGASAVASHVTGGATLYDFNSGKGASVPGGQKADVWYDTRLTLDGMKLLSVRTDGAGKGRVRLTDTRSGKLFGSIDGPDDTPITTCSLSGDGARAFATFCGPTYCYDLTTLKAVGKVNIVCPANARMEPSRDGDMMPLIDGTEVKVWDGKGELPATGIPSPHGRPTATAISDHYEVVVIGTSTGAVAFHDRKHGTTVKHPAAHAGAVTAVCVYGNALAATAGEDGAVRVWDLKTGKPKQTFNGHHGKVLALRFDPDGRYVISSDDSFLFLVFGLNHDERARFAALTNDGKGVYASDGKGCRVFAADANHRGGRLAVQDYESFTFKWAGDQPITAAALPPDGRGLALGGGRGRVEWRADAHADPILVAQFGSSVAALEFSADGQRLLAATPDEWLVWDVAARKVLRHENRPSTAASISPDGKRVGVGTERMGLNGRTGTARVYLVDGGEEGAAEVPDGVSAIGFSPDGGKMLVACGRNEVREFITPAAHTTARKPARIYVGHTAQVNTVAFSPDGKRMASGAADGRVKVWDTDTGVEAIGVSVGGREAVQTVAFSPDGQLLVATPHDRPPVVFDGRPRYEAYKPQKPIGK